jgi:hypothetical protein
MSALVNFMRDVGSNEDAVRLLDDQPLKAYFFWHVPFEDNLFRMSYVKEEGPFSAPVRVCRCVRVLVVALCRVPALPRTAHFQNV